MATIDRSEATPAMEKAAPAPRKVIYKYIRFSSIQQAKGSSFARQNERIDKYAKENGFEVNDDLKLQDLGKSGFHGLNKEIDQGLGRFILAIEEGLIPTDGTSYLAVEQFDRLSREDISKAQSTLNSILEKNVNVITLMDGKIYTKESMKDFMQVLYSLFLMEQAHQESKKKSDRIKGAYAVKIKKLKELAEEQKEALAAWEKKKTGEKPEALINQIQFSSQVPFWIDQKIEVIGGRKFRKFIINEEKAKIIQYALSLLNDDNGYMNVASRLNAEGIPRIDFASNRKRSTRKDIWTNRAVNEFVNNDSIFGDLALHHNFFADSEYVIKGEKEIKATKKVVKREHIENIPNYYPSLVDKKMVMGLRARANAKKKGRVAGRTTTNNLFQNLLYCGKCGDSLHLHQTKRETKKGTYRRFYLVCYSKKHKACDAKMISYPEVEKALVNHLVMPAEASTDLSVEAKKIIKSRDDKILELEGEIKVIEDKLQQTQTTMLQGNIPMDIVLSVLAQLNGDKEFKLHKIVELNAEKEKLVTAMNSSPAKHDITNDDGRKAFKLAVKQMYAGFFLFTADQFVISIQNFGGAGFFNFDVINRRGRKIEAERTVSPMKAFQDKMQYLKNICSTYREGKLYDIVKGYKMNNLEIFEEDYKARGLPLPDSYNRADS